MTPAAPVPLTTRLSWVDLAKAVAIVLVVAHHGVQRLDALGMAPAALQTVNWRLGAFRMPLLLLASGIFAATTLAGPWRALMHKRVAHYLWIYALWCLLWLPFAAAVPATVLSPRSTDLPVVLEWALVPPDHLWFLYALALYTVLLRLVRRWPPAVAVAAAGLVSVLASSGALPLPAYQWRLMLTHLVFFVVGVRYGAQLRALAARTTPRTAAVSLALALAALGAAAAAELDALPGVPLLLAALVVTAATALCVLAAPTRAGRAGAWLGERTLPVYLLHVPVLALLALPGEAWGWRGSPAVGALLLPAAVALAVTVSLALHRLLSGPARAGWLFALPRRWAWRPATATASVPAVGSPAVR